MRNALIVVLAIGITTSLAGAGGSAVDEVEPNDTLLTSQSLGTLSGALAIQGSLDAGDVDFFSFTVTGESLFTASVFDFTPNVNDDSDSVIALFDSAGTKLAFNDDDGVELLSSLSFHIVSPGTYHVAVSGFPDSGFIGKHDEDFVYKLVIATSPIPAPAGLAAIAGLGLLRGRRRRR